MVHVGLTKSTISFNFTCLSHETKPKAVYYMLKDIVIKSAFKQPLEFEQLILKLPTINNFVAKLPGIHCWKKEMETQTELSGLM